MMRGYVREEGIEDEEVFAWEHNDEVRGTVVKFEEGCEVLGRNPEIFGYDSLRALAL